MKLDKESILYAIKKFSEQTERIKNPTSYILTILYRVPEQYHFDIKNQVAHDLTPDIQMCNKKGKNHQFANFHQRTYDYEKLEKELLNRQ